MLLFLMKIYRKLQFRDFLLSFASSLLYHHNTFIQFINKLRLWTLKNKKSDWYFSYIFLHAPHLHEIEHRSLGARFQFSLLWGALLTLIHLLLLFLEDGVKVDSIMTDDRIVLDGHRLSLGRTRACELRFLLLLKRTSGVERRNLKLHEIWFCLLYLDGVDST